MDKKQIIEKTKKYLESTDSLGFNIGDSLDETVTFLSKLPMEDIEALLDRSTLLPEEKKVLFESIEETKGRLPDKELPKSEQGRREQEREIARRKRR
jgi:hypothetical protein